MKDGGAGRRKAMNDGRERRERDREINGMYSSQ